MGARQGDGAFVSKLQLMFGHQENICEHIGKLGPWGFNHHINIKGRWAGPGVVVTEVVVVMGFRGRSWTEGTFGETGGDWKGAEFDINIEGRWAGPGVVVTEVVVVMSFSGRSWTAGSFGKNGGGWKGAQFDFR